MWKAVSLAFHTLSFPWPALERRVAKSQSLQGPFWEREPLVRAADYSASALRSVLDERLGDDVLIYKPQEIAGVKGAIYLGAPGGSGMVLPKLTFDEIANQEHISTNVIILSLAPAPDPRTPPAAPELFPPRRPPPAASPQPPPMHRCSPSLAHIAVTSPA
jgi:hypothetical protein